MSRLTATARDRTPRTDRLPAPSATFVGLTAAFSATAFALYMGLADNAYGILAFVVLGWVITLCMHEYGHALAAYRLGDRSVLDKGYLSLDPLRYTDPGLSLLMPLLGLLMGGFALTGGSVYVDHARLRGRNAGAIVSACGPLANLIVLAALTLPFHLGWSGLDESPDLACGLAFLGFLQAMALVLNLLPVPGLDGYGILRPFLPEGVREKADGLAVMASLGLFIALWFVPPFSGFIVAVTANLTDAAGIPLEYVVAGMKTALFWL